MKFNGKRLWFFFIIFLVVVGGCTSANRLSEPVGKFHQATTGTIGITQPYLTQLNRVERRLKFTQALADPQKQIDPSFFTPTFTPAGIRARLECLELIDLYATRLGQIADSKASEKLATNADALGAGLANIGASIEKITGDAGKIKDFVGPASALAKFVGQMWIESQRKRALELAIREAAPTVNRVLDLLETDLREAYRGKIEALALGYNNLTLAYEKKKGEMTYLDRKAILSDLETLANEYEELTSFSIPPQDLINRMRKAHEAMVVAAENLDKIETFKDFAAAVELFAQRVQQAQAILKSLRENLS